jgi:hypothetical protein
MSFSNCPRAIWRVSKLPKGYLESFTNCPRAIWRKSPNTPSIFSKYPLRLLFKGNLVKIPLTFYAMSGIIVIKKTRGAAKGYLGDLKWVQGVFLRYPTSDVRNSMRQSQVEFFTSRVGYRAKLHELPFTRISPNTMR